jgi:formylglycine-generating enzyme required for sulfatase activity
MVLIPGGWFAMGDENGMAPTTGPIHQVRTDPLFMDATETTNTQLATVYNWARNNGFSVVYPGWMSTDPVALQAGESVHPLAACGVEICDIRNDMILVKGLTPNLPDDQTRPARSITWLGAAAYCNFRSLMDGLDPCYDLTSGACDFSKSGYRLPTEAEWERAARGGMTGQYFPWKNRAEDPGDCIDASMACYVAAASVATDGYPANGYGLFGMAGNVREWCNDWFVADAYATGTLAVNPRGPASGAEKILRGGGWNDSAAALRCARRSSAAPGILDAATGFRCVLPISRNPCIALDGPLEFDLLIDTPYTEFGYTAWDFQDGILSGNVVVANSVDPSTPGIHLVTYDVVDSDGHAAAQRTRTVHVTLGNPPSLYLNGSEPVVVPLGTPYEEPGYSAFDLEDGTLSDSVVVTGTVDHATQGLYVLNYSVTDSHGNTTSKRRHVSVSIGNPPKIHLSPRTTMELDVGQSYEEPGFSATDDEDGDITASVVVSGTVDTSAPGSGELAYTVTDSDGNPSVPLVRKIIVEDRSPPNLLLTEGPTVPWDLGEPFVEPGWTAVDNLDGDCASEVIVEGGVDTSAEGIRTRTYTVSDNAGNTIQRTRYINVMDRLPAPPGMVRVPAGTFGMGDHRNLVYPGIYGFYGNCPRDEENWDLPVHDVYVSDFFIAAHEVTEEEFCAALSDYLARDQIHLEQDPVEATAWNVDLKIGGKWLYAGDIAKSQLVSGSPPRIVPIPGTARHPATPGTAAAVALYANFKSIQDGLNPCYDLSAYPPTVDISKNGYRAPTEAEWEKAARGGLAAMHYPWGGAGEDWGEGVFRADLLALYQLEDVGSHPPNGYGIYDMAGNAIEFCADAFVADAYSQPWATVPDPVILDPAIGAPHVLRGGPYATNFDERTFRCCARFHKHSNKRRYLRGGIRLVRRP